MLPVPILLLIIIILIPLRAVEPQGGANFAYNGFRNANLILGDVATVTQNGLLRLTNDTLLQKGRAFYRAPLHFKNSSSSNTTTTASFSTTFVFGIVPETPNFGGHGLAFVISPSVELPGGAAQQYLGIFGADNNGNFTNHIFAIEHDIATNAELKDIDDNHVGVDINGLVSIKSAPAAYFSDGRWNNFSLSGGNPIQTWIEYDGNLKQVTVTVAPLRLPRPQRPLLSAVVDLAPVFLDPMYVGFSSSTGQLRATHYILGWSYNTNGRAPPLDLTSLPALPRLTPKPKPKILTLGLPLIAGFLALAAVSAAILTVRRKIKYSEVLEEWELEYGPDRFRYKDLFRATKGFGDDELLGIGGFGRVYRGILPSSKMQVAVKRVSHDSKQGMKEFIAEIVSLGRMRHRNLVPLLGYCRRKGELLLVYDYMPNGSLDKFLFDDHKFALNWNQRFGIVKGVAAGLVYLHEEWEQCVLHRDVKASNVLLDSDLNGKLGDFGLARLYDHGAAPKTTRVVGTIGYLAPELTRTMKASTSTDVFAFGIFMLEVATGRRPVQHPETSQSGDAVVLRERVFDCWTRGPILEASDPRLRGDYVVDEIELVLKLGLVCSNAIAGSRPRMRQVVQILEGRAPFTELLISSRAESSTEGRDYSTLNDTSSTDNVVVETVSAAESLLSGGR